MSVEGIQAVTMHEETAGDGGRRRRTGGRGGRHFWSFYQVCAERTPRFATWYVAYGAPWCWPAITPERFASAAGEEEP